MLQSIDTLIAFVVIMTVASLFVTIVVQMASAALSLRGKNLANALALTFQTIDPSLAEKAHQLAAKILTDPLLSDSTLTTKDKKKGIGWIAARKGPWDFKDLRGAAHLASAIRAEEVYAVLRRLKERKENAGKAEAELADARDGLAKAKTASDKEAAQARVADAKTALVVKTSGDAAALQDTATKILQALVTPADRAAAVAGQLGKFLEIADAISGAPIKEQLLAAVENTSSALVVEVDAARVKFGAWFNSAQDRAQQWFQLHTRSLTIATSILIALLLQLDAVEIFHFVSTNAAARNALVASADKVIREADGALDEKGGLIKRIADAATKPGQASVDLAGINHTGELQAAIAQRDRESFNPEAFDRLVREATTAYYKDQNDRLSDLASGVSATGFEFIPVGYWRWPAGGEVKGSIRNMVPHLPGIALFAALLTLGAPYWFNVLKNLASLRPALARSIGKEEAAQTAAKG